MQTANRVIVNTGILYVKMFITIGVSFYSTRIILNALGAADYGIYNVIGGVVGMLSFLNVAMTSATQRFLSFNMGTKDIFRIKNIFANSIILHFAIGVALIFLFELVGLYLINNALKISAERLETAEYLFHFVVCSTFLSVISVPYDAVVNAHENMLFIAITNIIESILKLAIAFYLIFTHQDKLLVYGFLLMVTSILLRMIKWMYCKRNYPECTVQVFKEYDSTVIKELTSFAGWNLFGVLCYIFRNQGVSVVLNLFYGTVVNAAYGIANLINGQMSFLSQMMMKTIRPQMMKSEGGGDRERMLRLSVIASKFSFFLFAFFLIPVLIEMPFILKVWLKNVPENTVLFCRLILVLTLIQQWSMGIMAGVQSIGNIKTYQTIAGSIQLLTLPIGYVYLYLGYPAYSILAVAIVLEIIASIFRVYYFSYLTSYSALKFIKEVVLISLIPFAFTFFAGVLLHHIITGELLRLLLVFISTGLLYLLLVYYVGINKQEVHHIDGMFITIKKRIWK